jgi:hypothetical protein
MANLSEEKLVTLFQSMLKENQAPLKKDMQSTLALLRGV